MKTRLWYWLGVLLTGCFLNINVSQAQDDDTPNYDESKIPEYDLPGLINEGTDAAAWESTRRPEILHLLRQELFGARMESPDSVVYKQKLIDEHAINDKAVYSNVDIYIYKDGRSFPLRIFIYLPKKPTDKVPGFILINNRAAGTEAPRKQIETGFWSIEMLIDNGVAAVSFNTQNMDPDNSKAGNFGNGIHGLLEDESKRTGSSWGTLAGWAYGVTLAMDYLETLDKVDHTKIGVVGHSRGGKTALWAGALDQRIAMVVSNDSGCGGAAISRRRYGEKVKRINTTFPHWFCDDFKKYNDKEDEMPFDQHFLLALIAPRALYVASAGEDQWADPHGEFISAREASVVYQLYNHNGIADEEWPDVGKQVHGDKVGYHLRPGKHNLTPYDWERYIDFFKKNID